MSVSPTSDPTQGDSSVPANRPRRARWLPIAAVLATLAVLAAAAAAPVPHGHARPSATTVGQHRAAAGRPDPSPSQRNPLTELAEHLGDAPSDSQHGRYTYVHTHYWALDTSADANRTTSRPAVFDEQLWIANDLSGRDQLTRLPDQPAGVPPQWITPRPATGSIDDFPPGGRSRSLPQPPSADPDTLAAQLNTDQPRANGPQSLVRAIADIYRDIVPDRAVRAAILHLLASTSAVTYRGEVTDPRRPHRDRRQRVSIPAATNTNCRTPAPTARRTASSKNRVRTASAGSSTPCCTSPSNPRIICGPCSVARSRANGSSNSRSSRACSRARIDAVHNAVRASGSRSAPIHSM